MKVGYNTGFLIPVGAKNITITENTPSRNYLGKVLTFTIIAGIQKQSSRGVLQKDVFKNLTKFAGKHLCQSPFLNKVAGLRAESGTDVFL